LSAGSKSRIFFAAGAPGRPAVLGGGEGHQDTSPQAWFIRFILAFSHLAPPPPRIAPPLVILVHPPPSGPLHLAQFGEAGGQSMVKFFLTNSYAHRASKASGQRRPELEPRSVFLIVKYFLVVIQWWRNPIFRGPRS
jgi:hypothetical protein